MPSNSYTAIVIIGGVALLIGLLGGGLEVSQIKIRPLPPGLRAFSFVVGIILIALGLALDPSLQNPMGGTSLPTTTPTGVANLPATTSAPPVETLALSTEIAILTETPTPEDDRFTWVEEQIRILDSSQLIWRECPLESGDFCAKWHFDDNGNRPIALQILNCNQDGTWIDESGIERIGLEVGTYDRVSGITVRRACPPIDPNLEAKLCGDKAFTNGTFTTSSPEFIRPSGYTSGWITSDPSQVVLPDGSVADIPIRYVLIVEDLPSLQFRGISLGNISGCWLRSDISRSSIEEDAEYQLERMKVDAPNAIAGIYRVSAEGLIELTQK